MAVVYRADMKIIERLWRRSLDFGRMIKFSHTVFALPFALSAVVLAQKTYPLSFMDLFWILLAMVGARSAAMGFNRIVDAGYDRRNPRTAGREIPSGKLTLTSAWLFVILFSGLFIVAARMLGPLCFYLSFPVLGVLLAYSFTKRFTVLCHVYLGFAISLAPLGAWIAVTGQFSWRAGLLSLALMNYIAGFDILYACQDIGFDRETALHSIPARYGVEKAMRMAVLLHLAAIGFMVLMMPVFGLGKIYFAAVGVIGALFIIEHRLVHPDDLRHINVAFFHINSIISVVFFLGIFLDTVIA